MEKKTVGHTSLTVEVEIDKDAIYDLVVAAGTNGLGPADIREIVECTINCQVTFPDFLAGTLRHEMVECAREVVKLRSGSREAIDAFNMSFFAGIEAKR